MIAELIAALLVTVVWIVGMLLVTALLVHVGPLIRDAFRIVIRAWWDR